MSQDGSDDKEETSQTDAMCRDFLVDPNSSIARRFRELELALHRARCDAEVWLTAWEQSPKEAPSARIDIVRDAVIEECARAAEKRFAKATAHHTVKAIAKAIRALKTDPVGIVERLETALASQIEITNQERSAKENAEAKLRSLPTNPSYVNVSDKKEDTDAL